MGIKRNLPLESIKVIGVPSDKVNFVKRLLSNNSIKVVAMDNINNKFYYAEDYNIDIYYDKFNKLKECMKNPKKKFSFKMEELRKLMIERFLLKVKGFMHIKYNNEEEVINGKSR